MVKVDEIPGFFEPGAQPTLRDLFAAQALTGLVTGRSINADWLAVEAYKVADAMLEARKQ